MTRRLKLDMFLWRCTLDVYISTFICTWICSILFRCTSYLLSPLCRVRWCYLAGKLFWYSFYVCVTCRWVAAQSVFYHLYNQVSYMSLNEISPLTFSIGNTMKRVTVIVSSIIIFHTQVRPVNAVGAAIAIFGTFLYSQVVTYLFVFDWNFLFYSCWVLAWTVGS